MTAASQVARWQPIACAALVAIVVAVMGGFATDTGAWYQALKKPAFQPPDWAFGPAWTIIYAFTILSAASAWQHMRTYRQRATILILFGFNIVLNVLWSVLFFWVRRPDLALFEVVFFWGSIAALLWVLWPRARRAAWLLVPYLVWVTVASVLNLAVVQLNHLLAS